MSTPKVLSHRGVSSLWPENGLIAFQKAIELGSDGIECDLHMSTDGHIVLIHDDDVTRTTDGQGLVSEMTLAELRRLRLGGTKVGDETIPTLDELFEMFKPTNLHMQLEVKQAGIEQALVRKIEDYGLVDQVEISSFIESVGEGVKACNGDIKTSLLTSAFDVMVYEHLRPHLNAVDLSLNENLNDGVVRRIRDDGLGLNIWTVNSEEGFERCIAFKPDFIISDFPQLIMKTLGRDIPEWAERKD